MSFYDSEIKKTLIHFVEEFKLVIRDLQKFFSLESVTRLPDMITVLLNYSIKHEEFVGKLIERKHAK